MEEYREKLEKMYQKLNEEEDPLLKKWYQSLIPKAILLFPVVAFGSVSYTHLTLPTNREV